MSLECLSNIYRIHSFLIKFLLKTATFDCILQESMYIYTIAVQRSSCEVIFVTFCRLYNGYNLSEKNALRRQIEYEIKFPFKRKACQVYEVKRHK